MISTTLLKRATANALAYLRTVPDVQEAEVFMASNANLLTRLVYTSQIPSNGVEEPKSVESFGVGIRAVFKAGGYGPGGPGRQAGGSGTPMAPRAGFGSEAGDVSLAAVERALDKARRAAVSDPEFVSLPRIDASRRSIANYHDRALIRLDDGQLVDLGWSVVDGCLDAFQSSEELLGWAGSPERVKTLGLILTGDVMVIQERIAIGNTSAARVLTDETALITSVATSMVEKRFTKGTAWHVGCTLEGFGAGPGGAAARNAIDAADGVTLPAGDYRVVLGPQPVTDLFNNLLLPSLHLGTFHAWSSAFQGKLGKQIASPMLSVYDHGAIRGLGASKGITDEGLPTGRTDLIRDGRLVGLLSNWYQTQRVLHDADGAKKLGVEPSRHQRAIVPRNGFRSGQGGGRHFDRPPHATATNVMVEGANEVPSDELLRSIGDGVYIGRIWYTYPINGLAKADFTCTVVGDSYLIRDGKIAEPLRPNSVRINDNLHRVLDGILGIGQTKKATIVWNADEIVHAPEIAVGALEFAEVGDALQAGD